jgi:RNA recognition motif-containing protein
VVIIPYYSSGSSIPNKILFISNLPPETTEVMLKMLFEQFPGLQEIRLVPSRTDIAFVEYENESQATEAMSSLQEFRIVPTHPMKITYANKWYNQTIVWFCYVILQNINYKQELIINSCYKL